MVTRSRNFQIGGMIALPLLVVVLAFLFTSEEPPVDMSRTLYFDSRDSESVPAGSGHSQHAIAALPDGVREDPDAKNFTNAGSMTYSHYAVATQARDAQALGGFGSSGNLARKVSEECEGAGLYLLAQPGVEREGGMRLVLVNRTKSMLAFSAGDSQLDIVQEAMDPNGEWRPIERMPWFFCGNSFHRVFLKPDHFWEFPARRYEGSMQTRLRFALGLTDDRALYSNEFEGSVNPGQFETEEHKS